MEIIVVAGPNGSGKTTIITTKGLSDSDYTCLSADSISKMLETEISDEAERMYTAWNTCEKFREALISSRESFVWKTVFSDARRLDVLRYAKSKGYAITLIFVTTQSVDINVDRVSKRVQSGGHNVPEDKIRSRYENTMRLLPEILALSTKARVYDNSANDATPILAIVLEENRLTLEYDAPEWATDVFEKMGSCCSSELSLLRL